MELKIRIDKNGKSMGSHYSLFRGSNRQSFHERFVQVSAGDLLLLRLGNDYGYSSDKELYEGERLTYELQRFKS
ncbi:hypothetical protein OUZ56_014764 [Daphnia magna]|uniref:Uncharacterized protein n=1 Tax=Daphnia magna TaxID=35525 RepID=A0ABR0AKT5_9CRUS|nr:hypothetical protein OUZ56_014764 [Daphnia magna]